MVSYPPLQVLQNGFQRHEGGPQEALPAPTYSHRNILCRREELPSRFSEENEEQNLFEVFWNLNFSLYFFLFFYFKGSEYPIFLSEIYFLRFIAVGTSLTDSAHESVSGQRSSAKVEQGYDTAVIF